MIMVKPTNPGVYWYSPLCVFAPPIPYRMKLDMEQNWWIQGTKEDEWIAVQSSDLAGESYWCEIYQG